MVFADVGQRFEQHNHELYSNALTISPHYDDKVDHTQVMSQYADSTTDYENPSGEIFVSLIKHAILL